MGGEHLNPRSMPLHPGSANEDGAQRLLSDPHHLELGLKALQLATEGVALRGGIDQAKVGVVADDQPGAGAKDRPFSLMVSENRILQPTRLDPHLDRRALATGDHQPVQPNQIFGTPGLATIGPESSQHSEVGLEPALNGEDADA